MNLDAAEGFCSGGVFILGNYVFLFWDFVLVWVRARSLGFRFLGLSAWFWLLGFSVSGLLGHSISYSLFVVYGLLAS